MDTLKTGFFRHVGQTSPFPIGLEIESCTGIYYVTPKGEKYMDLTSGIAVSNLGHQVPEIIDAIISQAQKNLHTMVYGEFVERPQVRYAEKLIQHLPTKMDAVYYCTSGSEAVEAAIKLAKRTTKRSGLVSCLGSYHGSTNGALSLMGGDAYKSAYQPLLPEVSFITYNDKQDLYNITDNTAAVFIELVQGASGITVINEEFLLALANRCKEVGALLIFDEIQTGFGRTGKLFAWQHYNIEPDMILLAKSMGGGVPIGALCASQTLLSHFTNHPILGHINTFGGNALAVAAAEAVLHYFETHTQLLAQSIEKAERIVNQLKAEKLIANITYQGLSIAIHFESSEVARRFTETCFQEKMVVIGFLFNDKAVRISPPLTISDEEVDSMIFSLKKVLKKCE